MDNGCVCCTLRGDLEGALRQLECTATGFDAIIIETTGLADPVPVAGTFKNTVIGELSRMPSSA